MALDLIGGAVFTVLYDGVKQAMGRTDTFKELLKDLKFTLECLRRQATAIQEIGRYNLELGLPNDEIEELERQMDRGARLVSKLLNFRLWNYCCINSYTDQLVDLDRSLRRLLENLMLQDIRDVKEILDLSRKNHKELEEVKEAQSSMQKLLKQIAGSMIGEASTSAAGGGNSNTEMVVTDQNLVNSGNKVASLDGGAGTALGATYRILLEVVTGLKDKNVMYRPLLENLKSTLEYLKPLVEEMAQHNKVLDRPKEELELFAMQMEKGVELVYKCSKVRLWGSYKKYEYTNKILGLDVFCRRHLSILREQVARDVKQTSVSIRNVMEEIFVLRRNAEMVVRRMKSSSAAAQNSYETIADDEREFETSVEVKRHMQPIAGGAPFITCYKCLKVLQIPAGFHFSERRCHNKLRCGACSEVLKFSLMKSHVGPVTGEVENNSASTSQQSADKYYFEKLSYNISSSPGVETGTLTRSDSFRSISRTSEIWTTDLESITSSESSPFIRRQVPELPVSDGLYFGPSPKETEKRDGWEWSFSHGVPY